MESVLRLSALCLAVVVFSVFLKKDRPDMALLLAISMCVAVLYMLLQRWGEMIGFLGELLTETGIISAAFEPLFKVVGIALISKVGGELCRDAGEKAIGNLVETAGAFAAVVTVIPLFTAAWDMLQELL